MLFLFWGASCSPALFIIQDTEKVNHLILKTMFREFQCILGEMAARKREHFEVIRSRGHFYCIGKMLSTWGPRGIRNSEFARSSLSRDWVGEREALPVETEDLG